MSRRLPAEWEAQSAVQLTFPRADGDWAEYYPKAAAAVGRIAAVISAYQPVLLVEPERGAAEPYLPKRTLHPIHRIQLPADDSWARDHGAITVLEEERPVLLDFTFNGWGLKFPAAQDNLLTRRLYAAKVFGEVVYQRPPWVLEGGSLESDGQGTLLSTEACLLSPNRNDGHERAAVESMLRKELGVKRILWLRHGYLAGDDTDSHIDTLARFCDPRTIAYVRCTDPEDEHYEALHQMEAELRTFRTVEGAPYRLVPLPWPPPIRAADGHRLPATYANFLIINGAVLLPTYGVSTDSAAMRALEELFPDREVIGIDCRAVIEQHGSLHCLTMQFPRALEVGRSL